MAVEAAEWNGSDFDRPLTREGEALMRREAETMKALDLRLDIVVTSPLRRAKQTASIVAKHLKLPERTIDDRRLAGGFAPIHVAEILAEHGSVSAIMFVGHEPDLSRTVGELVGGADIDFKKGALARVDVTNRSTLRGRLVWLIPAKVLGKVTAR